ncbi:MAG: hypothetical protein MN733_05650, partial [Nitrososphaera sp.]|nr:hypothetical protein [Nitrososphaera sp.]
QGSTNYSPGVDIHGQYQWKFEVPRDHRDRPIKTKELLALHNMVKKAYRICLAPHFFVCMQPIH